MTEKVNLQTKIQKYRQANPKLNNLSEEKILSIMVQNGENNLTEAQNSSILSMKNNQNDNMGLRLKKSVPNANPERTLYLQSGRKVVYSKSSDGKLLLKYYGTDGTQLNRDYFKKVEGLISISADGKTYTITKDGKKRTLKAKDPTKGAIDQNLARLNNDEKRLNKTKKEQGFIGSSWDWIKNKTGIGDGSDKAQKQIDEERKLLNQIKISKISKIDFKEVTGLDYSKENLEKFIRGELSQAAAKIDGYKEGQEMAADVAGDMVSGIAAVGIYTSAVIAAPFTGGTSIVAGAAAATVSGALIKSGVKALDTVGTDKKYTLQNFHHDALTGGFSGLIAPLTGGIGGAVGKTVATKLGIQTVKQVGKEVAEEIVEQGVKDGIKQGLKTALTNPTGYEYVGGNFLKRSTPLAVEMATDGALGGMIDGGFRAGLDNNWDGNAILSGTIEGGIGGSIMSPIIGGGMKAVGKGSQNIFGKNNVHIDADKNIIRTDVINGLLKNDIDIDYAATVFRDLDNLEDAFKLTEPNLSESDRLRFNIIKKELTEKVNTIETIKDIIPMAKGDKVISISPMQNGRKIILSTSNQQQYTIIQYDHIDITQSQKHIKKIAKIDFQNEDIVGGHCIETYEKLSDEDIRKLLKIDLNEKTKIEIIKDKKDITIKVNRPIGGGKTIQQHMELEYKEGTPSFYMINTKKNSENNSPIISSSQNIKSLMPEKIFDEIFELMQNNPQKCMSYYTYTNKRGQTYQLFKYDGMYYIQQVRKDNSLITFYPINEKDLKKNYEEVIIDRIPTWK